jgi:solute carrier family 35 protein F1/2
MSDSKNQVAVQATASNADFTSSSPKDTAEVVVQTQRDEEALAPADQVDTQKKGFFAYFKTKEFYIVLLLG